MLQAHRGLLWSVSQTFAQVPTAASIHFVSGQSGPLLLVSLTPNATAQNIGVEGVTSLGTDRLCLPESFTIVFSSSNYEEMPQYVGALRYLFLHKARVVSDRIYAVGKAENPCNIGGRSHGWFGTITAEQSLPVYVETSLPGSDFTDFAIKGERALLLGYWGRQHSESLSPVILLNRYVAGEREAFELDELFITSLDRLDPPEAGEPTSSPAQAFLGTGLSSYGLHLIAGDENARIWGRVGEYPFAAEIVWP